MPLTAEGTRLQESTPNLEEMFQGCCSEGARFPPARWLVENAVIPHSTFVTVALILIQGAIAVLILTRGDLVTPALIAGAAFSLIAALASSPGGTGGNLLLAASQVTLAAYR